MTSSYHIVLYDSYGDKLTTVNHRGIFDRLLSGTFMTYAAGHLAGDRESYGDVHARLFEMVTARSAFITLLL